MSDTRMYGVLSTHIDSVWPEAKPYIEKAILRSGFSSKYHIEDIYKSLCDQDMQLWVAYDNKGICAIEVTQIFNFPRQKLLMLLFTAGRGAANWLHFVGVLKEFAIAKGCVSDGNPNIECLGRKGWEKLAKPFGIKKISILFKFYF